MKLHFVTGGGPDACREETGQGCDVLVFGFSALGEVDYRSELDGTSQKLESLALLSRRLNCVAVAGCVTLSCGFRRRSAVVAERGKLLGVSDQLYTQGEQLHCGAHLKVYPTAAGKLGICVGEDLFFPQVPVRCGRGDQRVWAGEGGGAPPDAARKRLLRGRARLYVRGRGGAGRFGEGGTSVPFGKAGERLRAFPFAGIPHLFPPPARRERVGLTFSQKGD